jgi:drug/metabolite transporter (DMT)-like permease
MNTIAKTENTLHIKPSSEKLVHALMLLTIALIASSFPVGATITHALPPGVMMLIRFMLAAFLFCPYVLIRNGFTFPDLKQSIHYAIISIPLVGFFWCMFESLRYTSLLNTGALFTLVPTVTAIWAYLINRDGITGVRAAGIILGTVGALWIVFRGDWQAFVNLSLNYGDIVFMIGCLSLGLYNVLIKRLYNNEPMELMTFWVLCWGSFWLLLLSLGDLKTIEWSKVNINVYAGIAYLSFFTTLVTFFLMQFSIVKIGATKVSAYNFLTPVFVIVLSVSLGLESFVPVTIPGIFLVVGAMLLIEREGGRKETTAQQIK